MAPKDKAGIENIQSGRIDFYIPLSFETKLSYSELCQKVATCVNEIITDHLSGIEESIKDRLSEIPQIHVKTKENTTKERLLCRRFGKRRAKEKRTCPKAVGSMSIDFQPSKNGIMIKIIPEGTDIYTARRDTLFQEQATFEQIYGTSFTDLQNRFVLLPLRVQLTNRKYVWLNSILYIFGNMMGILKIELPLIDVSTSPLKEYNFDGYVDNIEDPWGLEFNGQNPPLEDVCIAHLKKIANYCNIVIYPHREGILRNIIMVRFDGIPKQIENIPDEIQEDLYCIIAAPVKKIECTSYKKVAKEYLDKQSWGKHNMKYITSTTGGCLSIIDESLLNWQHERCKKVGINEQDVMDNMLIDNLCSNAEFALIIPLLKQLNEIYAYDMKCINYKEIRNVQMTYNRNVMFISTLQEHCYGTVSEQVAAFERMMPYYLKEDIKAAKMKALDRIIADKESQRSSSLHSFVSIAGFLIALLFGLPAIHETVSIIREVCCFINKDIIYLTINNVSVAAWILFMIVLGANVWRKCRKK